MGKHRKEADAQAAMEQFDRLHAESMGRVADARRKQDSRDAIDRTKFVSSKKPGDTKPKQVDL